MAGVSFSSLIDETMVALAGYGAPNDRATFLSADITPASTTATVVDGTALSQGVAEIGDELVYIESITGNTVTFSPDGRGFYGTTPAAHVSGSRVTFAPAWSRSRVTTSLNDAIQGTYPTLFGVGTATFTGRPPVNTYELPADCERVLSVTATVPGPSREPQRVRRYAMDAHASQSVFASGVSLTVQEGLFPGSTVTVTYRKVPSALNPTDDFTASGLSPTAKVAVKYAALSELVSAMDSSRLVTSTAQGDEFDNQTAVGSGARIGAQFYQRYVLELERERARQAQRTPAPFNIRTR